MSSSIETEILNKYNLTTLYPAVWPEEKDAADEDEEYVEPATKVTQKPVRRSQSRFSILEPSPRFSRQIPGAERSKDGVETLVQKDEQDPLGMYPSVVQVLRAKNVQVEDDIKLRNRFLLSSTTFSPSLFLSQVHNEASTDALLSGLDFLSRSIEKKSASLKVLVESNFDRFVGAKATIDRVYNEMRAQGKDQSESLSAPPQGRTRSRSSFSGRKSSANLSSGMIDAVPAEKRKNALVKESEYGVQGIKVPLTEVAVKAEEVWGPALNGREREETLKSILESVEHHRGMFEVGSAIEEAIRHKDHETIVEEYKRARKYAEEARYIAEQATSAQTPLTDAEIHQVIVTARMWSDVERQIEKFKRDSLRLLQKHLRSVPTSSNISAEPSKLDTPKVIEFWEHVYALMNTLLSTKGGLLGELIEYWDIALSFLSGRAQRNLPTGHHGQSSVHHRLSSENKAELERGTTELIGILRDHLFSFFSDPPIEDVSLLFSPLPPTTPTPTTPGTPRSGILSPTSATRSRFDLSKVPPPSPSRGETWEKYAFWPPHSNALSGSHYLSKTLVLIGTAANELASLQVPESGGSGRIDESLRLLLGGVRERSVQAVCAAWNTDAEKLKVLEDWTRHVDRKDVTNLPQRFLAVQSFLLNNLQKILYVEASSKTKIDVVVPPSNKLLQMVRSQFVTSLYRTLSGMVECAERGRKALGDEFEVKSDDLTIDEQEDHTGNEWGRVDANKKSIRLLLTLANMSAFQSEITPTLLNLFETLFSVQLTDETNRIRDVLSQLDSQLFRSYTKPHATKINSTIQSGIFSPTWAPPPGPNQKFVADRDPSPYVFSVLLDLVIVHTESSTTSAPLTPRILRSLFESTTASLIQTFQSDNLPTISLPQLMQATLDVEFMAQTLSAYTTEQASQIQTDIYQVLDQKTDNAARVKLQDELGNLRTVLKRLREGTKVQFACFRRVKRANTGQMAGPGGGGEDERGRR
ncbi:hypothetical protein GGP41_001951 [Bipolaris sorokiniana]|uniref:Exocyst complex component SEC5 n=1 Tax=Cochliobolus sativus TaxID=45130 RepID=A0A8H5ZQN0_COCSA|nr:hypothetical protein GGP41_001951 [Bipolaris sorokiniana]